MHCTQIVVLSELPNGNPVVFRYEHLQNILDLILLERPKNPLEVFEKYSLMLKRTYVYREVNFERVFVEHISQKFCQRTLQMYKVISSSI